MPQPALEAISHALSGSLFALLDWWIDHGRATDPGEMDTLFHRIVWSDAQIPPAPSR